MKSFYSRFLWVNVLLLLFSLSSTSQIVPGQIIRPCTSPSGKLILDPNNGSADGSLINDYTSKNASGFGTTGAVPDIDHSEIPYKPVPPYALEPYADLRRGADHLFTDYVPDVNGGSYYMHYDGSNLLFRIRMGTIIPGAKGYSLLIDTDGKFGPTGANADPNYIAATTGTGGNPGFEMEVVLCTGGATNGVQIYNVDGTDKPVLVPAGLTGWENYSQLSIAATNDNGDPDFLLDFYVPATVFTNAPFNLNLTTTPIRIIPTTVMSPQAAIGGPKSDIYGLDDGLFPNTNTEYEVLLGAQPGIPISNWGGSLTTTPSKQCTAPPTIANSSLTAGSVIIKGSWIKGTLTGNEQNSAKIIIYKKAVGTGTISEVASVASVVSGNTWETPSAVNLVEGDVIYAKAVALNESECMMSNNITVGPSCSSADKPTTLLTFNASSRGMNGTGWTAGHYISIWRITAAGHFFFAAGIPTGTGNTGFATAAGTGGWQYGGGSTNGGGKLAPGTFMAFDSIAGGCTSTPLYACAPAENNSIGTVTTTLAPSINNLTSIYPSTTTISGTFPTTGSVIKVYVDSVLVGVATNLSASTWEYTFSKALKVGQKIRVTAQQGENLATKNFYCEGETIATVSCTTPTPTISVNADGTLTGGSLITGISSAPANSNIRIFNTTNTSTPYATATVQSDGSWVTSVPAVAGQSYYATAINTISPCNESVKTADVTAIAPTSSARCGSITTSSITATTNEVVGKLATAVSGTVVNLYIDGNFIGSTATSTTDWTISSIPTGSIYASGILTIGIKEGAALEIFCTNTGSSAIVSCNPPTPPNVTPENATIAPNQSQTYTIKNPTAGIFYGIADATTGRSLARGVWATSSSEFSITTNPISSPGTVNVIIKATSVSSTEMCSINSASRTLSVTTSLPLTLLNFTGRKESGSIALKWSTADEVNTSHFEIERSSNGASFVKIGEVAVSGSRQGNYGFTDDNPITGNNYYRLRMVDKDLKFTYSKVIVFNMAPNNSIIAVWPNPFLDIINVDTYFKEAGKVNVKLLNESGSLIENKDMIGHKGVNTLQFEPAKKLSPGVYILQIQTNEGINQQKLIRINN